MFNQGHQFHQDSLTKEEFILELSPGNAGPSSEASLCKYYTLVSFHQYEYVTVCRWITGFKNWDRPRATGYQPTEFKGSLPKRCWCLGLGQNALSCPNPNPQNAIGVRPSAFGGSEPTHRAPQVSQSLWGYIFKERLVEMFVAKPPAWFHWSLLFLVNLAALSNEQRPSVSAPGSQKVPKSQQFLEKMTGCFDDSQGKDCASEPPHQSFCMFCCQNM